MQFSLLNDEQRVATGWGFKHLPVFSNRIHTSTLGLPPHAGCNRHHQDYETFLVGNPRKPSFVTVTGWGVDEHLLLVVENSSQLC